MKNLIIKEDNNTPGVILDYDKGIIELSGKSIPDRASNFYEPVMEWINKYIQNPNSETTFNFKLEYANTGSEKYLLDILRRMESLHKSGKKCKVDWYYEEDDEDIFETGEDYKKYLDVPFNLICVPVED